MEDNSCPCCPYFFDGYCHNCTHEDCEKEQVESLNCENCGEYEEKECASCIEFSHFKPKKKEAF